VIDQTEKVRLFNALLASELGAICQYMVAAEQDDLAGHERLHQMSQRRAIAEMHHAERLIQLILKAGGRPHMQPTPPSFSDKPENRISLAIHSETKAETDYDTVIRRCKGEPAEVLDVLKANRKDEADHLEQLKLHNARIREVGVVKWLAEVEAPPVS
jgi:bacterioferritin